MKKILFINAPSAFAAYAGTKVNATVHVQLIVSYAMLAAVAREMGKTVEILDLAIFQDWQNLLVKKIKEFKPDLIGMTATSPLFPEVAELSFILRKLTGSNCILVLGGPHASVLPDESLLRSAFDIVVRGDGENSLCSIISGDSYKGIPGIYYKDGEEIKSTPGSNPVMDLDRLPYPAYDLYNISQYKTPTIVARKNPSVVYMTSRGCMFRCTFCSRYVYETKVRYKSPEVVIDEIKYFKRLGIKCIRMADDMFTADMPRAKRICELMIQHNIDLPWALTNGLKTNRVDLEFLRLAKRAGCYEVAFGFESGDQASLDSINKGIKVEDGFKAMELVRKAGLDSLGYFMFGLPADTEKSLKKTTAYAKKINPTMAKVTITIPFPGTRLFDELEEKGLIKTRDWFKYNLHKPEEIYQHPNLSMKTLEKYYNDFYIKYYLRLSYLIPTFFRSLKDGSIFIKIYYALQTFLPNIFVGRTKKNVAAN